MTVPTSIPGTSTPNKKAKGKDEKFARGVELGAQSVAGTVGTAYGAAKFRDTHREQYPKRHTETVRRAVAAAQKRGASPKQAAKVAHVLSGSPGHASPKTGRMPRVSKPGFKSLVVVAGAGATATGAHRYQSVERYLKAKKAERDGVSKADFARTPLTQIARVQKVPARHAAKPYVGTRRKPALTDKIKNQIMVHEPKIQRGLEEFVDLYKADGRVAPRVTLSSIEKGAAMTVSAFGVQGISKADHRSAGGKHEVRPPKPTALDTPHRRDSTRANVASNHQGASGGTRTITTNDKWSGRPGTAGPGVRAARFAGANKGKIATGAALAGAGAVGAAATTKFRREAKREMGKSAFGADVEVSKISAGDVTTALGRGGDKLKSLKPYRGTRRAAQTPFERGDRAVQQINRGVNALKTDRKVQVAVGGGAVGAVGAGAAAGRHNMTQSNDPDYVGKSAFGAIRKDDGNLPTRRKPNAAPTGGRRAAAAGAGVFHSAVAGRKGEKLGAVGSTAGHAYGGAVLGAVAGAATKNKTLTALGPSIGYHTGVQRAVTTNSRKGRYKDQS